MNYREEPPGIVDEYSTWKAACPWERHQVASFAAGFNAARHLYESKPSPQNQESPLTSSTPELPSHGQET